MTPDQFRATIKGLGLNQAQAAEMLGYGASSRISEIVRGIERPSVAVVRLLQAYVDGYRPADWPAS